MMRGDNKSRIFVIALIIMGFSAHQLFLSSYINKFVTANYKNELKTLSEAVGIIVRESDYFEGKQNLKFSQKNQEILDTSLRQISDAVKRDYGKKETSDMMKRVNLTDLLESYALSSGFTNVYDFESSHFMKASSQMDEIAATDRFKSFLAQLKAKGSMSGQIPLRNGNVAIEAKYYKDLNVASLVAADDDFLRKKYMRKQMMSIDSVDGILLFDRDGEVIASNFNKEINRTDIKVAIFDKSENRENEYIPVSIDVNGQTHDMISYKRTVDDITVVTLKNNENIVRFVMMIQVASFAFLFAVVGIILFVIEFLKSHAAEKLLRISRYDERLPIYTVEIMSLLVSMILIVLSGIFVSQTMNIYFNDLFRSNIRSEVNSVAKGIAINKELLDSNTDTLIDNSKKGLESTIKTVSILLDAGRISYKSRYYKTSKDGTLNVFLITNDQMSQDPRYGYIRDRYGGKKGMQLIETEYIKNSGATGEFGGLRQTALSYSKKHDIFIAAERILDAEYVDRSKFINKFYPGSVETEGTGKTRMYIVNSGGKVLFDTSNLRIGSNFELPKGGYSDDIDLLLNYRGGFYEYNEVIDGSGRKMTMYVGFSNELGRYVIGMGDFDFLNKHICDYSRILIVLTMATIFFSISALTAVVTIRSKRLID